MESCWLYKNIVKLAPSVSNVVFEKEVIFHSNNTLKAHKFVQQRRFLFHYSRTFSTTDWVQIFTDLLFYAYVGIHKVRVLVFDNYQRCPVPLNTYSNCLLPTIATRRGYEWRSEPYLTWNLKKSLLTMFF